MATQLGHLPLATRSNVLRLARTKLSARDFSVSTTRSKEKLVILGSGWGGYEVLKRVDKKRWDVTIVSASSYFNFTPLLASCAVGTLEFRCAVEPVRRYAPESTFYQAWCDKIDLDQKIITCVSATPLPSHPDRAHSPAQIASPPTTSGAFDVRYDKLVIAVGAYSQTFNVPGVKPHAHFLKDVKDARAIRLRILECFEEASQPTISDVERRKVLHFCIVGGGPTGVEFAAELHDLISTDLKRHYPALARMARITLYDVAPHILSSFDRSLVQYAESKFKRDGITMKLGYHVERVFADSMIVKEEGEVPFGLLVWSTGLAPNPLVQSLTAVAKDAKSHSLLTNKHLNVLRADGRVDEDVWAIGDAAAISERALPATAQVASQQGAYLASKLNRLARSRAAPAAFEFRNRGSLAYLGDWKAIYDRTGAETGPKAKEAGRWAWLLWRSAYFSQTRSLRNKITVPLYWFLNCECARDIRT